VEFRMAFRNFKDPLFYDKNANDKIFVPVGGVSGSLNAYRPQMLSRISSRGSPKQIEASSMRKQSQTPSREP